MLTIFALPKPFKKEFDIIQKNAIQSWTLFWPKCEIILFGDEEGTAEVAAELGARYIPQVAQNEFGTPLVNDVFEKAQKIAKNNILAYVNADIILMSDFMEAIEKIKNERDFLMVGQRWDFDLEKLLDLNDSNWEAKLRAEVIKKGKLHPQTGIDYFVFRKSFFRNIPPFALGRTIWDEWLLYEAWKRKAKIIDASQVIMAIHQNHSYHYSKEGTEAKRNLKLAGGYRKAFTIKDATHILTPRRLKLAPKMSFMRKLEIMPYFGFLVRQRKKIINLFKK
jgi:hypothetical protein